MDKPKKDQDTKSHLIGLVDNSFFNDIVSFKLFTTFELHPLKFSIKSNSTKVWYKLKKIDIIDKINIEYIQNFGENFNKHKIVTIKIP